MADQPTIPGVEAFAGALYEAPNQTYVRKSELADSLSRIFGITFNDAMRMVNRDEKNAKLAFLDATLEADAYSNGYGDDERGAILVSRGFTDFVTEDMEGFHEHPDR